MLDGQADRTLNEETDSHTMRKTHRCSTNFENQKVVGRKLKFSKLLVNKGRYLKRLHREFESLQNSSLKSNRTKMAETSLKIAVSCLGIML